MFYNALLFKDNYEITLIEIEAQIDASFSGLIDSLVYIILK